MSDEYKLTSTSDTEWLTPHIQSFPVNATAVSDVDRISFEVRPSRRLCACCQCATLFPYQFPAASRRVLYLAVISRSWARV